MIYFQKMDMRNHGMGHQNGKVLKRYPNLKNENFSHFIYWSVETNTSLLSREHIYVSPAKLVWITSGLCFKSEAERKKHHKSKRTAIISIIYPDVGIIYYLGEEANTGSNIEGPTKDKQLKSVWTDFRHGIISLHFLANEWLGVCDGHFPRIAADLVTKRLVIHI